MAILSEVLRSNKEIKKNGIINVLMPAYVKIGRSTKEPPKLIKSVKNINELNHVKIVN